jgi:hypothetical protein
MKKSKTLLSKKQMNFAYGMGAAVVIIGALFKITHLELGPLTGNLMLTVGLLVEAGIFALSAFEPVEEDSPTTQSKGHAGSVDLSGSSKKYNEELETAAKQLESINALYKTQLQSTNDFNELKEQTSELTSNLSSLNKTVQGITSAFNAR